MKITIPIREVLSTLKKNFEAHRQELEEALKGWNMEVHEALDRVAAAVDSKGLRADVNEVWALFHKKPKDNREDYARHISALETAASHGQETVEMDIDEHDQLMRDNFDWRARSRESNAGYATKGKGL